MLRHIVACGICKAIRVGMASTVSPYRLDLLDHSFRRKISLADDWPELPGAWFRKTWTVINFPCGRQALLSPVTLVVCYLHILQRWLPRGKLSTRYPGFFQTRSTPHMCVAAVEAMSDSMRPVLDRRTGSGQNPQQRQGCLRPPFTHQRQHIMRLQRRKITFTQEQTSQRRCKRSGRTSRSIKRPSHGTGWK